MLLALDLIGIFVFAASGGLLAVRRQLDVVGVLVIALASGLGGGIVRDLLIGAVPPPAIADWRYLLMPVFAGLVVFFWHPAISRLERPINVVDAFGVGLFCVAGALKAHEFGMGPVPAAVLGMVTAVGGGVLAAVLLRQVPAIMVHGELYAIPALAGSAVAVVGLESGLPVLVVSVAGAGVATGWRLLAILRGWTGPMPPVPPALR